MLQTSPLSKTPSDRLINISHRTTGTAHLFAFAAGMLTITLFALTPTTTRLAISQLNGLDIALFRVVGGGIAAFILLALFRVRPPYERAQWKLQALFSTGSFMLFPTLFSVGTQNTSAIHASLIMASMPLVTSSLGFVLDQRAPRIAWLLGAALAVIGEVVLIFTTNESLSAQPTIAGDLLVLLGCAAFCVGAVAGSRAARFIGPWRSTLWAIAVAGAALFPIAATHIESFSSLTFDPVTWIALFHLSMGATILACVAWSFALARGGIARVAPLQFAQPLLALIFAAALLRERVSFASIFCGITILTGVVVAWRNASAATPTNGSVSSRGTPSGADLPASAARPRKTLFFLLATVAATTATIAWARPGWADKKPVDLLLVLAADVSYSVNDEEYRLQQAGYAAAIASPSVLSAIAKNTHGQIGICYVQWSGDAAQKVVVDWTLIDNAEASRAFANHIVSSPRSFAERTSISAAIDFSAAQFDRAPFQSPRRVIDISGDGDNDAGRSVANARDEAVKHGIVINGLVILNNSPIASEHTAPIGGLEEYYRREVIGGSNAFAVIVNDFAAFSEALARKLATEIAEGAGRRVKVSAGLIGWAPPPTVMEKE
jgi:drug/metabolite transporter (DMT)-like permease